MCAHKKNLNKKQTKKTITNRDNKGRLNNSK